MAVFPFVRPASRSPGMLACLALCTLGTLATRVAQAAASEPVKAGRHVALRALGDLPDWSGVWVLVDGRDAAAASFGTDNGVVPLTDAYRRIRADAVASKAQANLSTCLPAGPTAVLQHGILFEVLFSPGRVTMLFEDGEVRRIHTDGRRHRPLAELRDSFMGDSTGHWEGATLVVDTVGFPNGELWQNHGVRATLNTRLQERIALGGDGRLRIDSSMSDPAIFTTPYTYTRMYKHPPLTLGEPACAQNNRDTGTSLNTRMPQ